MYTTKHSMRSFTVCEDQSHVLIQRHPDETVGRVPIPLATAVWCMESNKDRDRNAPVVVFSFAIPQNNETRCDTLIMFTQRDHGTPISWPSWSTMPVPVPQCVPVARWIPLPNIRSPDQQTILKTVTREQTIGEAQTAQTMDRRCNDITQQGNDNEFMQTLDYYVTLRVKHAYLQMNASGILERLGAVHDKITDLRALLKGSEVAHTWTPPTDIPEDHTGGGNTDDPNRICHPQVFDFDVE